MNSVFKLQYPIVFDCTTEYLVDIQAASIGFHYLKQCCNDYSYTFSINSRNVTFGSEGIKILILMNNTKLPFKKMTLNFILHRGLLHSWGKGRNSIFQA